MRPSALFFACQETWLARHPDMIPQVWSHSAPALWARPPLVVAGHLLHTRTECAAAQLLTGGRRVRFFTA